MHTICDALPTSLVGTVTFFFIFLSKVANVRSFPFLGAICGRLIWQKCWGSLVVYGYREAILNVWDLSCQYTERLSMANGELSFM